MFRTLLAPQRATTARSVPSVMMRWCAVMLLLCSTVTAQTPAPTMTPAPTPPPSISVVPTSVPVPSPTSSPTTSAPTVFPTLAPTQSRSPTLSPTSSAPTMSVVPSSSPTPLPTVSPTTSSPTPFPSSAPTGGHCVQFSDIIYELDFCFDPIYWSHYDISSSLNLTDAQISAFQEYVTIRDGVYFNNTLLANTGAHRREVADCLGFSVRYMCHKYIPRCSGSKNRKLCSGLCKEFNDRCTIGGVNLLEARFGSSQYSCSGLAHNDCSAGIGLFSNLSVLLTLTAIGLVTTLLGSIY